MRDYVFEGGTAVVTGAASGIGAALAEGLAARGSNLGLVDRDEVGLKGVAGEIRSRYPDLDVRTYVNDLGDTGGLAALSQRILGTSNASPCSSTTPVWPSVGSSHRSVWRTSTG